MSPITPGMTERGASRSPGRKIGSPGLEAVGSPPVSPLRLRCLMRRKRRQRIHGLFLSRRGGARMSAITIGGPPFKTLAEAEEACEAMLGHLTR